MRVKKIAWPVDNYTESEKKKLQLITEIQNLYRSGTSKRKISQITGKSRNTVKKYLDGDPEILCRNNAHSQLATCTGKIINDIRSGLTATTISRQLQSEGYQYSLSNLRIYVAMVAKKYGLELSKYSCTHTKYTEDGKKLPQKVYITRKGIFNHLWMDIKLSPDHKEYLWTRNDILPELESCIREFREIFNKKSMPSLYIFIDRYKASSIKELASFAKGLERDLDAIENAVASPLSNGFVEGTNSKLKTIKKAMYGRCGHLLLSAKLMYKPRTEY